MVFTSISRETKVGSKAYHEAWGSLSSVTSKHASSMKTIFHSGIKTQTVFSSGAEIGA